MVSRLIRTCGWSVSASSGRILVVLELDVGEVGLRALISSGRTRRSTTVMATTFEPATTPLWAIGVAIAMAFDQLWPGRFGMLDG